MGKKNLATAIVFGPNVDFDYVFKMLNADDFIRYANVLNEHFRKKNEPVLSRGIHRGPASPTKTVLLPLFIDDGHLYSNTRVYTHYLAAYIKEKLGLYIKSKGY
jgi:hypothetical protein